MRGRVLKILVLAGLATTALAGCASSGTPTSGTEQIDSFAVTYTIKPSGVVHAKETLVYDFGASGGKHGIDRYLDSRFSTDTPGTDRVYTYDNITVASPTGASPIFSTSLRNVLDIRIGNTHTTTGGVQTYVIGYDIHGALNSPTQADGTTLDEFYWNVTGTQWTIPIVATSVTVKGAATVSDAACFAGASGSTASCSRHTSDGDSATFAQGTLHPGEGLTIDAGYPAGTYDAVAPVLAPTLPADSPAVTSGSNDGPDPFWSPWNWGLGLLLLVGIPVAFRILIAVRARDQEYAGVTPGTIPSDPANAPVGKAPRAETIVPFYTPPAGVPVGAANTVLTKARKNVDITATLIDLAVRGYLTIDEQDGGNRHKAKDYTLTATPDRATAKKAAARPGTPEAAELLPHESLLLGKLFAGGRASVTLSSLNNTFASDMRTITASLDSWIQNQKYFIDKLTRSHPFPSLAIGLGIVLFIVSVSFGLPVLLVAIGAVVGGIIALGSSRKAARRSALGHAVLIQLQGFRLYIGTAEANQIRFEETDDVFSRYMPWAIAFGEAEHWAGVFKQLAEEGKYAPQPDWYTTNGNAFAAGYLAGSMSSFATIGSALSSFDAMAESSLNSTPSSSGSSGFSSGGFGGGGGGFSGGGGGGGGGGSW